MIFQLAGLKNAAAAVEGHRQVQVEWVLELDPDLILFDTGYGRFDGWMETLQSDPRFSTLSAVRNDGVARFPARDLSTISHFVVEAAREIRERLRQEKIVGIHED
jgi:ABC-type Fe3+-hydroxamate transport system substrate-binding protein